MLNYIGADPLLLMLLCGFSIFWVKVIENTWREVRQVFIISARSNERDGQPGKVHVTALLVGSH